MTDHDPTTGLAVMRDRLAKELADRLTRKTDEPTDPAAARIDQHLIAAHQVASLAAAKESAHE